MFKYFSIDEVRAIIDIIHLPITTMEEAWNKSIEKWKIQSNPKYKEFYIVGSLPQITSCGLCNLFHWYFMHLSVDTATPDTCKLCPIFQDDTINKLCMNGPFFEWEHNKTIHNAEKMLGYLCYLKWHKPNSEWRSNPIRTEEEAFEMTIGKWYALAYRDDVPLESAVRRCGLCLLSLSAEKNPRTGLMDVTCTECPITKETGIICLKDADYKEIHDTFTKIRDYEENDIRSRAQKIFHRLTAHWVAKEDI